MTTFIETPVFPGCPKFGLTSEPGYDVSIIKLSSGRERRNRNWSRPLTRVTITVGPGPQRDGEVQELLEFWHAVGGTAIGFRYKDWSDYKSCRVSDTVSSTDQPLVATGDSPETYQLTKRYTAGAAIQDREISKPVSGTILIADGGTLKAETTDYTIDYSTGLVSLLFSPSGTLTWGGEFDIPVRFDSTFPIEHLQRDFQTVSFTLQEVRV